MREKGGNITLVGDNIDRPVSNSIQNEDVQKVDPCWSVCTFHLGESAFHEEAVPIVDPMQEEAGLGSVQLGVQGEHGFVEEEDAEPEHTTVKTMAVGEQGHCSSFDRAAEEVHVNGPVEVQPSNGLQWPRRVTLHLWRRRLRTLPMGRYLLGQ